MSTAEWALVVAVVAAFAAVMNMIASWATYRRACARPRMVLEPCVEHLDGELVVVCKVRFVSSRPTPVLIESLRATQEKNHLSTDNDIEMEIEGADKNELPASDALVWKVVIRAGSIAPLGNVQMVARLLDGTYVVPDEFDQMLLDAKLGTLEREYRLSRMTEDERQEVLGRPRSLLI
ncbi:hypothetical protein [Streptomyces dioscori]|uniref:hypothetical protein n=1 Tax=Streptomyces dioscori TaxID=2109333 RepID=UPI00131A8FB5|nr:hypothetical protein [Streptomyces dioscori]